MSEPWRPTGLNMPNVMTPGAWVIVGVVLAAIIAGITVMIVRARKATYIPWKPLPLYSPSARYFVKGGAPLDLVFLVAALREAERLLAQHTKWSTTVHAAFENVRVYVMDTESWDMNGVKVAGLDPSGRSVVVGPSLAALCHEMAHQCEEKLENLIDYGHTRWGLNGIAAANDEFDTWLSRRGSADRVAAGIVALTPPRPRGVELCRHAGRIT